jgi:hypothetical protein
MRGPGARVLRALIAAGLAAPAAAAAPAVAAPEGPPVLRAVRAEGPIAIDGLLDEPAWGRAEPITSFTQRYPAEGEPATQPTEVRVLYDDERLYVGARLRDDAPSRIVAREMKEDADLDSDDAFAVFLDTFRDRRNGYFFETNPLGARSDALIFDEGRNNSFDWDGVWEVAARVGGEGWTVEMEIPFRTLHFDAGETNPWGLQVRRIIRRNAEDAFWAPIPRNEDPFRLSRAGELTGLHGVRQGSHVEVKPYALGGVLRRPTFGEAAADGTAESGLDARWAITPNLSAILTLNTDFAETEVDDQQVNVTRFPLFFPEKREFFLESKGHFDFGYRKPGPGQQPAVIPFFSRRIGLAPREVQGGEVNAPVPIAGGVKLAGRIGRYNLGFLTVGTEEDGSNPATSFSVLRVSRDVMSRSNWGILAVSQEPSGPDAPADPDDPFDGVHSNRTYGADLNVSVLENLKFGGSLLQTRTPGIRRGEGMGRLYLDWSNSAWEVDLSYADVASGLNPEVGFVPRRGIEELVSFVGWSWRSATAPVRRIEPHGRQVYTMDQDHELATRRRHLAVSFELRDGSELEAAWNPVFDVLTETFELGEGVVIPPGAYDADAFFLLWEGDPSRVVSGEVFAEFGGFFDGTFQSVRPGASARISEHVKSSLAVQRTNIHLPARPGAPAGGRPGAPLVGDLPPSEFLATLVQARLGLTFTTRLFLDALVQYNTDADDLSSNLRLNYKYRPGSDLYVVYNERRDIEGLPTDLVDRTFTVKWTYLAAF